jgi:GDP-L-fucose synthase
MPTQSLRARRNFCPDYSHVVAALIRGFHEAKVSGVSDVVVWATGTSRRELLYVGDLADAAFI